MLYSSQSLKRNLGLVSLALLAAVSLTHAMEDQQGWDAGKSMTPALAHTINVSYVDPDKELVGKDGPSPSNQALVVVLTQDDPQVLMCKDYDERKLGNGNFRPTYGALKASFGFGLPKDHTFANSFDALVKGPANISLYKILDTIQPKNIKVANFVYKEGGQDWGPAGTIPLFLQDVKAEKIVAQLNHSANEAFESRSEGDIFTGRYRDFCLVPLKSLLRTGSDQPAVLDESKLEMIEVNGQLTKLWDENQMRKNLLPHVNAYITQHFGK